MADTTAPTLPPCTCDLAPNRRYHSDECQAAWDAYTDALLLAEAADTQAAKAQTVEEVDRAVDALRAVPAIPGRNSRPAILTLLRRRTALVNPAPAPVREPVPAYPPAGLIVTSYDPFDADPTEVF